MTTRTSRLLLIGVLFLLPACAGVAALLSPICTHDVQPGGVIESDLFGFIPIAETPPAAAGFVEGVVEEAPWAAPEFFGLPDSAQLAIVEGWNAQHGGALPPRIPWTSILGLILSGGTLGNALTTKLRQSGQANLAVVKDKQTSWPGTILSALAILSPVPGLMPAEAKGKIADGQVPAGAPT